MIHVRGMSESHSKNLQDGMFWLFWEIQPATLIQNSIPKDTVNEVQGLNEDSFQTCWSQTVCLPCIHFQEAIGK